MRYEYHLRSPICRSEGHTWSRYPGPLAKILSRVFKRPETCGRCGTKRWV